MSTTLPSSRCHILTGIGVFYFEDGDSHKAFDEDPITQTIGLTICALAHECGGGNIDLRSDVIIRMEDWSLHTMVRVSAGTL